MITTVLHEQLGNQLFQWATGFALARRHNTTLQLITTNYGRSGRYLYLKRCPITAKFINPVAGILFHRLCRRPLYVVTTYSERFGDRRPVEEVPENIMTFRSTFLSLPDGVLLNGMFQSWQYFFHVRSDILQELDMAAFSFNSTVTALLKRIEETNSVAIHVRRTDYLTAENRERFEVCNLSYYLRCINYLKMHFEDLSFFVFSDDIEWCSRNFPNERFTFCSSENPRLDPLSDFFLMSRCRHKIISNSTFSWWAAFLSTSSPAFTLCPAQWTNTHDAPIFDKLLPGWIPISINR